MRPSTWRDAVRSRRDASARWRRAGADLSLRGPLPAGVPQTRTTTPNKELRGTQRSFRVNRQIRIPEVRLIDENGEQVGVVATEDARKRAEEAGLDLVEVSPTARPPVCRILDFGKFKYAAAQEGARGRTSTPPRSSRSCACAR